MAMGDDNDNDIRQQPSLESNGEETVETERQSNAGGGVKKSAHAAQQDGLETQQLPEDIFVKTVGNKGLVIKMMGQDNSELFDRVYEYKQLNPQTAWEQTATEAFADEPAAVYLIRSLWPGCLPDYVLKAPKEKDSEIYEKHQKVRDDYERLMMKEGLVLQYEPMTVLKDGAQATYIKVFVPFKRLCQEAERERLFLEVAATAEDANAAGGNSKEDRKHKPAACFDASNLSKFVGGDASELGESHVRMSFFSNSHRILLTHGIINNVRTKALKANRAKNIVSLMEKSVYTECFPLHDGTYREKGSKANLRSRLYKYWAKTFWGKQPLEDIRAYFGEEVAFYFAWIGFYTQWLSYAAAVGAVVFVFGMSKAVRSDGSFDALLKALFDNELSPWYALFISLWSTLMLEFWKRRSTTLAYRWNMMEYEQAEPVRPQWKAKHSRISPVTGKLEKHFSGKTYKFRLFVSTAALCMAVLVVMGGVATNIVVRVGLTNTYTAGQASLIASTFASVFGLFTIYLLGAIYQYVAVKMNKWENHKTETIFRDAFIIKKFVFDFVNNFALLFYIGLFKQYVGQGVLGQPNWNDQCSSSCMVDLMIQLLVIFVGKQMVFQMIEMLSPRIAAWKERRKQKAAVKKASLVDDDLNSASAPWVKEDALAKFAGLQPEYNELALQFGFMTLFIVAFPVGTLFAFINNIFEIRGDAYRLLVNTQRIVPSRAQDIGRWEAIFTAISYFAVITNACLIAFTSESFETMYLSAFTSNEAKLVVRLLFVVGFEHLVVGLKVLFAVVIPNTPHAVQLAIKREQYLADVTLNGAPEAQDDPEADGLPRDDI